jgi:hypothetical protein
MIVLRSIIVHPQVHSTAGTIAQQGSDRFQQAVMTAVENGTMVVAAAACSAHSISERHRKDRQCADQQDRLFSRPGTHSPAVTAMASGGINTQPAAIN